ncbi:1477_t:CDS:2, partial [Rhizophagus irregularis]
LSSLDSVSWEYFDFRRPFVAQQKFELDQNDFLRNQLDFLEMASLEECFEVQLVVPVFALYREMRLQN